MLLGVFASRARPPTPALQKGKGKKREERGRDEGRSSRASTLPLIPPILFSSPANPAHRKEVPRASDQKREKKGRKGKGRKVEPDRWRRADVNSVSPFGHVRARFFFSVREGKGGGGGREGSFAQADGRSRSSSTRSASCGPTSTAY